VSLLARGTGRFMLSGRRRPAGDNQVVEPAEADDARP
jgi:hypothetical protein